MTEEKRGGYRANAKRPKLPPEEKKVRVELHVKPETKAAIDKAGKPRVIGIIEDALQIKQDPLK